MRLAGAVLLLYLLIVGTGYALTKGWIEWPPLPGVQYAPAPPFDEAKFMNGVKQIGVLAGLVVEGRAVTDIRVQGTAYNPATRTMQVWMSANARGVYSVFLADCRVADAGGWFCARPVDAGGVMRLN